MIWKMNKTDTFLYTVSATILLTLGCLKAGGADSPSLLAAQAGSTELVLEKDGDQVRIPLEERIMVSSAYDANNRVSGVYMGMTADAVRIQEKGESWERDLPLDEIGSIRIGNTKSMKDYVLGGIKYGGLVSVGAGVVVTSSIMIDGGLKSGQFQIALVWGGLVTVLSGIYTIPGGALIGFVRGNMAERDRVEYVIGNGHWIIVQQ